MTLEKCGLVWLTTPKTPSEDRTPLARLDAVLTSAIEQKHIVEQVGGRIDDFAGGPRELVAVHGIDGPGGRLAQLGPERSVLSLQPKVVGFQVKVCPPAICRSIPLGLGFEDSRPI